MEFGGSVTIHCEGARSDDVLEGSVTLLRKEHKMIQRQRKQAFFWILYQSDTGRLRFPSKSPGLAGTFKEPGVTALNKGSSTECPVFKSFMSC